DLEAACEAGLVRTVKGMSEHTERRILDAIRQAKAPDAHRVLLPEALGLAGELRTQLGSVAGGGTADAAGDLRRWTEWVDELSLVVATERRADTLKRACQAPLLAEVTSVDATGLAGRLATGLPVRVLVTPRAAYATALLRATGSAGHVERLE